MMVHSNNISFEHTLLLYDINQYDMIPAILSLPIQVKIVRFAKIVVWT